MKERQKKHEKLAAAAAAVEKYVAGVEFALQLAQDKKFGKRLFSGAQHATEAWRSARRGRGLASAATRLAADQSVQAELRNARRDLKQAYARVDANRPGHQLVTLARLTSLAGLASLAALPQVRKRVSGVIAAAQKNGRHLQGLATTNNSALPQVRKRVSAVIAAASKNGRHLQGLATTNNSSGTKARPRSLEDLTKEELYTRAQEAEIPGRSEMSKEELVDALRARG